MKNLTEFKLLNRLEMKSVLGGVSLICLLGGDALCVHNCIVQGYPAMGEGSNRNAHCDENNDCICGNGKPTRPGPWN